MNLGRGPQRVDLVLQHGRRQIEVDRPLPCRRRGRACHVRRRRRRRSPDRRTTATSGGRCAPARPARREARRTGRGARGAASRRDRSAGAPPSPAAAHRGTRSVAPCASVGPSRATTSSTPSSVSHCAFGSASVAVRTTTVPPPAATPCTPGSSVSASRLPSTDRRHTCSTVASSSGLARNSTPGPSTVATERTCSSAGVTGSPSTSRRRAPSRSAHVTSRPRGSSRGTPPTSSTHASSWSRHRNDVAAGERVDVEHGQLALIARLHGDDQSLVRPLHVDEVRVLIVVPVDGDHRPVEIDQMERRRRVGGAGGRIGDLARRHARGLQDR